MISDSEIKVHFSTKLKEKQALQKKFSRNILWLTRTKVLPSCGRLVIRPSHLNERSVARIPMSQKSAGQQATDETGLARENRRPRGPQQCIMLRNLVQNCGKITCWCSIAFISHHPSPNNNAVRTESCSDEDIAKKNLFCLFTVGHEIFYFKFFLLSRHLITH